MSISIICGLFLIYLFIKSLLKPFSKLLKIAYIFLYITIMDRIMKKLLILISIFSVTYLNAQVIAKQNEDFDPLTLNEPPVSILNTSDIYEIISDVHGYTYGSVSENEFREIKMQGWKIQLFSTKNFYEADSIKNLANDQFPNEEVLSIFNSPYYKIRIGNCKDRNNAEQLLQDAKNRQFNSAWIIPSRIKVKERITANK